jgi:hypothetical protein
MNNFTIYFKMENFKNLNLFSSINNIFVFSLHGHSSKGAKCNVDGCDQDGARSLNTSKVENAGLRVNSSGKKTVLCKEHYKEYKKESKDERDLERARFDKF